MREGPKITSNWRRIACELTLADHGGCVALGDLEDLLHDERPGELRGGDGHSERGAREHGAEAGVPATTGILSKEDPEITSYGR